MSVFRAGQHAHIHMLHIRHVICEQRRTSAGLGAGKQSAAPPLQPAEPIFAAAARRVARRCDPNEGGNGPAPTPAAPPREGAPVGAAFPEQLAAGRRAASPQAGPLLMLSRHKIECCRQLLCRKRATWMWLGAAIPLVHRC